MKNVALKYVLLESPNSMIPKVKIGFEPESHRDIAALAIAQGYEVKGAGFVTYSESGTATPFGYSHSLKRGPGEQDKLYLTMMNKHTVDAASVR